MTEPDAPRRLTLLYQVWLLEVASSRLMRATLAGTGMRGEEYGLLSYLYANGPRTLTQAAHDLGHPVTTLSTLLAPWVESGEIVRRPHPSDGRARLLALSLPGRARLETVIPVFTAAYETLLRELEVRKADIEAMYETLDLLRTTVDRTVELIDLETAGVPRRDRTTEASPSEQT